MPAKKKITATEAARIAELKKKRQFRVFYYRQRTIEQLCALKTDEMVSLLSSRKRRVFKRKLGQKQKSLVQKLRAAKKAADINDKPARVNTHLRNMVIIPEMAGSVIGVHNGHHFIPVEVKPEMIGRYLGEFSISYTPVTHGRPGIGATHSSRFIPLK